MEDNVAAIAGAIERGDFDLVVALLQDEPELSNAIFAEGSTPLHLATLYNHKEIAELLISNGADVNAKDDNGYAPIFGAVFDYEAGDRRETVQMLIAHGADVNARDTGGLTPLHTAAMNGKKEIVELLLANKADPSLKTNSGITPEEFATETNHHDIAALFSESVARADEIHIPVTNGDLDKVEAVLKNRPELANAVDISGRTPLHIAVMFDRNEIIELLISLGADVNGYNREGQTSLHQAMMADSKEIAELLIAHGADVNAKMFSTGMTLLHRAANNNDKEAVEFLIARGADVNAQHKEGGTPLHQAAAWSSIGIVELLLANKADPRLKTNSGKTAEQVADENDHPDIAALLRHAVKNK